MDEEEEVKQTLAAIEQEAALFVRNLSYEELRVM
jgi:hypothetical protein